ncbi:MAG: hypothetical protein AAF639_31065 [Chloroflexota bacterium]
MSVQVCRANIQTILVAYLILVVPATLVSTFQTFLSANTTPPTAPTPPGALELVLILVIGIITIIGNLILQVIMLIVTEDMLYDRRTPLIPTITPRIGSLLLLGLRFVWGVLWRSLLLIVPGIIYSIRHGFYPMAHVLRDQRGGAALEYSRRTVEGNAWTVFWFTFLIAIISGGLSSLITSLLALLLNVVFASFLASIFSGLLSTLLYSGMVLLFLNLEFMRNSRP